MTRFLCLLAALCACACSTTPRGEPPIVLWHAYHGAEQQALEQAVKSLTTPVKLVQIPYDVFADKISNAIPNGNGPDLFIFAHDRLGDWVAGGLVESIGFYVDDALADDFADVPLRAMVYQNELYGLPLAVKSLALYYRPDLVTTPPATRDELLALCRSRRAQDAYALAYDNVDLYFHAGFLHSHGGAVFDAAGSLSIATPEAVAAAAFARTLRDLRCVPPDVDAPLATTLFNEGEAALVVSGPWFASDIAAGVPWKIAPLPRVGPKAAAPFLGAEGVWMSSRSQKPGKAFAVMQALASDASARLRARAARQVVPNRAIYEDAAIANDPVLSAFQRQFDQAVPMPATPEMRVVWQPYRRALERVVNEGIEPAIALSDAELEISGYIKKLRQP